MPKGLKTYIHVNQAVIKQNLKNDLDSPCITVKNSKSNTYTKRVDILDNDGNVLASVVQRMEKPLSCGARIWIETHQPVVFVGETESASCARERCLKKSLTKEKAGVKKSFNK